MAALPAIPLDTLLARRTPVLWPEAVAVVQAACEALAPADGAERLAPDLPGIRIRATGAVEVSDGTPGEASAARLARTLHALLPAKATPAPLRLLITKWIGTTSPHTIREFATELAYYARPEGAALIRALYERCVAAAVSGVVPASEAPPPLREEPAAQRPPRRQPRWLVPAAAAAAALASVGAWGLAQPSSPGLDLVAAATMTGDSLEAVATVATGGSVSGSAQSPAAGAPRRSADIRLPFRGASAAAAAAATPAAPGRAGTGAPLEAFTPPTAGAAASAPGIRVLRGDGIELTRIPTFTTPVSPDAGDTVATSVSPIYSSVDPGVEPPKLVYPQLPPPPEKPTDTVAINTMEVVVGEDGRVQTVQLISAPERMNDMMLLSAAKVWRFEPASRDGEPVRYRMRVSWATTP